MEQDSFLPKDKQSVWTYLYVIEENNSTEQTQENWIIYSRGSFEVTEIIGNLFEDKVTELYKDFRGNENFRIHIYPSVHRDFTDELNDKKRTQIEDQIKQIEAKLALIKTNGFDFDSKSESKQICRNTGLQIEKMISDQGEEYWNINQLNIELNNYEISSDPKKLEALVVGKLMILKAELEFSLIQLDRNLLIDATTSFWHKSTAPIDKFIYLFEFGNNRYDIFKWKIISLKENYKTNDQKGDLYLQQYSKEPLQLLDEPYEYKNSKGLIPLNYYYLYAEKGDKITMGIPVLHQFTGSSDMEPSSFYSYDNWDSNDLHLDMGWIDDSFYKFDFDTFIDGLKRMDDGLDESAFVSTLQILYKMAGMLLSEFSEDYNRYSKLFGQQAAIKLREKYFNNIWRL